MRWMVLAFVGALALGALADEPARDPFGPPPADHFGDTEDGAAARARFAESLALAKAALARQPADLRALNRAWELLSYFDLQADLIPLARVAVRQDGLEEKRLAALRGLLGRLLVEDAQSYDDWGFIMIINGNRVQPQRQETGTEALRLFVEAIDHLRAALRGDPDSMELRLALADAVEATTAEDSEERKEVGRLRTEAEALRLRAVGPAAEPASDPAEALREQAATLEQRTPEPDHVGALLLRKRALVLDFCAHTFDFEYEPGLFGPISLLASPDLIATNLTRTYLGRAGGTGTVPPHYIAPSVKKQLELVTALRLDSTPAAAATLLAVVRRADSVDDPLALAALESLVQGNHAAAREHLPRILAEAAMEDESNAPAAGCCLLARLAADMRVAEAATVLAKALAADRNLYFPLGVAAALGRIGGAAEAPALLAVAQDPDVDVYFRREAVAALGRIAPARLDDLASEPLLEVAVAAARYRIDENESSKGRLLAAIESEHEADDAARACAELGIVDARPALEGFLSHRAGHYAESIVKAALDRLGAP